MINDTSKSTFRLFRKAAEQGAGPAGLFAGIAGFFCDFVKPFLNLVPFFLVISLIGALVLWFGFIARGKQKSEVDTLDEVLHSKYGVAFGIFVLSSAFWLLMVPIFAITPQDGVLAAVVPPIGDFQQAVMKRFDLIDQKLDKGFGAVLQKIDQIDKSAGLIGSPASYNDYYHNAKIYELNGNMLEARKAFEKYFETNLVYFDPFVSYANILKSLEGPSTALELLGKLRDQYPDNPGAALIYAISKPKEDKVFLLEQLAAKYPDYGPIFYYILESTSYLDNGIPTLADQKKAQSALAKLDELEKTQGFSKYFIDKDQLALREAFLKQQRSQADGYYGQLVKNPVGFSFEYVNGSVSLGFVPMELVSEIFYRLDGQGDFISTGTMGVTSYVTNKSLPNYSVIVPLEIGKHKVEVKYKDNKDKLTDPVSFDFEITPVKISYMGYKILNPKTNKAGPYLYYSFYRAEDSYSGTLKYSIDNEKVDQTGEGMIYLDDLASGPHKLHWKAVSSDGKSYSGIFDFTI